MRFPTTSSCIWVAIPVDWVILHFMPVVQTDGRQVDGRTVTWLPKFLGWVDFHIFLGMGLRSPALCVRVELCYYSFSNVHLLDPLVTLRTHYKLLVRYAELQLTRAGNITGNGHFTLCCCQFMSARPIMSRLTGCNSVSVILGVVKTLLFVFVNCF